jgi:UDP-glucuronate decarboxylase
MLDNKIIYILRRILAIKPWYYLIMKILVTGGAGFLGSYLCEQLLEQEHEVICVDNLVTGTKKNIEKLLNNPRFEFLRHDVTFPLYVEVDGILNFACPASPIKYQIDPVQTMKTSVIGAVNMLGLAKRNKARILQASTSEIYGDPKISPQSEEYWGNVNSIGIRACYDEGKRAAETLFMDYLRQYSVDTRIVRIFNTYGPRMSETDGRVVSNFISQALRNEDITIYGDGTQTRSFCYVDDLINGILTMFFSENQNQPINLGNPDQISMNKLASEIIGFTKSSSKITYKALPQDDPVDRLPDISKAKQFFDWSPRINREEGLKRTIDYFKNQI